MNSFKRSIWPAAITVADVAVLLRLYPNWSRLGRDLGDARSWVERVGADQAALTLAATALWCVALWLAIGLGAALVAALPGRVGDLAHAVAHRLLPAVMLRAVAGVAGLGVLVAPVAAAAKSPAGSGPMTAAPAATAPTPTWPTDPRPQPHVRIGWPTDDSPATRPGDRNDPGPAKQRVATGTARLPNRADTTSDQTEPGDDTVRVEAGDSLWLIAAQRLGPNASDAEIAAAWPRWYAANAPVIGDDPSLIRPGQVLHAPAQPDH